MTLAIDVQSGIKRKEVMKKLIDIRYERNDIAFERGKFRVKGDIIDIYPVYMDSGYRLEFFGDDLEEISEINPLTGKKIRSRINRTMIMPASHYITMEGTIDDMIAEIKEEMEERVRYFKSKNLLIEAQRIQQRTEYDMEMIKEIGYCKGIENYSRYLSRKKEGETPYTLLDYFPEDFLIFMDESHIGVSQVRGMYNGDHARKGTLIENGFRLPSAFDNRPLKYDEFMKKANQLVYVSATPGDYEMNTSIGNVAEQLIRPTGIIDPDVEIRSTSNQIDDLMEEIRIRSERSERVLVTTLTKKMAEELTDYYSEFGIKVKYMHSGIETLERIDIIRGLRKKEFDVLVGINLLREGLDIPEVSLVAILEADKEGFLRSTRSLIQTMGRAARNLHGRVILYADKKTDSIKNALRETDRRREKQRQYNIKNGIEPESILKEISEDLIYLDYDTNFNDEKVGEIKKIFKNRKEIEKEIVRLEKKIKECASELDFEKAIEKRDEMLKLKEILLEF